MDRNDPLKHSRYKRLPQVWRLGQDAPRAVDSLGDEFRVTIFLTNRQADRAEKEAIATGLGDLQNWCQATLRQAINQLDDLDYQPMTPIVRTRQPASPSEIVAEMDLPDDPAFYQEVAGIDDTMEVQDATSPALSGPASSQIAKPQFPDNHPSSPPLPTHREAARPLDPALDMPAFSDSLERILQSLRSGSRPTETDVTRVAGTIDQLAQSLHDSDSLPRDLVRLVYRLAMESQVLITEVHPRLGLDLTVVTSVRRLQAAAGKLIERV
jgi:hypothetical protein